MQKLLIGQSGGPTAAINATLAGVINKALESNAFIEVLGSINGIDGVFNENFISLEKFRDENRINLLKQTPSSYLGSCRHKLAKDDTIFKAIFNIFKKHEISAFIYIGGNDSMDTVQKLSEYAIKINSDIQIIGVPKTIDNDLVLTDHTPGYASAAKYIVNSIRQLALDTSVYDMKSIIVAEIMGRNAGWLTAASALANDEKISPVDIICLPEVEFDAQKFIEKVKNIISKKSATIIAVSEGIKGKNGEYILSGNSKQDSSDGFKHAALGGVGKAVERLITNNIEIKTRTIEFSTLQRCNAETCSLCDINESFLQGEAAIDKLLEGKTAIMLGIVRASSKEYKTTIEEFDINLVANKEKTVPSEMISEDGFFVTAKFIDYCKPLIAGQPKIIYNNGIMDFEVR